MAGIRLRIENLLKEPAGIPSFAFAAMVACKNDDNKMELDSDGLPVLPPAPLQTLKDVLMKWYFRYLFLPVMGPVFIGGFWLTNKNVRKTFFSSFRTLYRIGYAKTSDFQSTPQLQKLWKTPSAQVYIQTSALMWQKREGYCGRATIRCILKSFGCDPLPPEAHGESKPDKFCSHLKDYSPIPLQTEIVPGDVDFPTFVKTLRRMKDGKVRIAINYLRTALFGFQFPWFFPTNFIIGMFGGHFSPVVGILDEESEDPLVGVFDVNHKYGGAYVIPASRLHASVATLDATAGKPRAVIVITEH